MRKRTLISSYHRVFRGEAGPAVLKDLRRKCLTFDRSSMGCNPELDPQKLAYFEGQRSVLLHIYRMLKTDPYAVVKNPTSVSVDDDIV